MAKHVLDVIKDASNLQYLSDLSIYHNHVETYKAVKKVGAHEREYPSKQWEEAYRYITGRGAYKGKGYRDILLDLQAGQAE